MKSTRLKTLIGMVCLAITFSSCDKLKEKLEKDVEYSDDGIEFVIPEITSTEAGAINLPIKITTDIEAEIKKKLTFGELLRANISTLTLELIDKDPDNNFTDIEYLSISFTAENLPELILANSVGMTHIKVPGNDYRALIIPGSQKDITSYLKAKDLTIHIQGKAKNTTNRSLRAKVYTGYNFRLTL